MRGFRSKLKAVKRRKKDGSTYWAARGFVPIRQPDGSFARSRVEHSLGGDTAAARQDEVDKLNKAYEDRALNVPLSFARAYLNYIAFHEVPLFAEKILNGARGKPGLGKRQCHEIDDTIMDELKDAIFEPDAKASYVNRHLYTPVIAILNMALKENAPRLTRPAGHKKRPPIKIPFDEWFALVVPHMSLDTAALVAFYTFHGRRLADALGRRPSDFRAKAEIIEDGDKIRTIYSGTLSIDDTKTDEPVFIDLHPSVVEMMLAMPDWQERQWLFTDGPTSGSNVRRDILIACLKASGYDADQAAAIAAKPTEHRAEIASMSVPYFSPHKLGRHAFATRLLRDGFSLKYVQEAGGWKTIEVVANTYGHLEQKEVTVAVHKVGNAFIERIGPLRGGKAGDDPPLKLLQGPENDD